MEFNPWDVPSLEVFHLYCCPECDSKHVTKSHFVEHALDHHPKARESMPRTLEMEEFNNDFASDFDGDENCDTSNVTSEIVTPEVTPKTETKLEFKCDICHIMVESKTALIVHIEEIHEEKIHNYECDICGKLYGNDKYLKYHRATRHPESRKASTRESRTRSTKIQKEPKEPKILPEPKEVFNVPSYKCDICDFVSYMYDKWKQHVKTHMIGKMYACSSCPETFKNRDKLTFHLATLHEKVEVKHKCDTCGKAFLDKHRLMRHLSVHVHKDYICEICAKVCDTEWNLKSHMRVHGPKKLKCDRCDKTFRLKSDLSNHRRISHHLYKIKPKDKVKKCDKCDIEYELPEELDDHLKECLEDLKSFVCKLCDTVWVSHLSLEHHIVNAHQRIMHCCDICGKAHSDNSKNLVHKREIHAKEHRFVCHLCGQSYIRKPPLDRHLCEKHGIGSRKMKCDICDKMFYDNGDLRQHKIEVHIRDKKFKCDRCEWAGVSEAKLKRHVQEKHIRDKVYPCDLCDYKAYRKGWLTAHVKNIHEKN